MVSQAEQPSEDPFGNIGGEWTEFENFTRHTDPRESNFQLRPILPPEDQRHESQIDITISRRFEEDLLMAFLLGLQRLTREAGVLELDTNLIEEMLTNTPCEAFQKEYEDVGNARIRAVYYGDSEDDEMTLEHTPCSFCKVFEFDIALDFLQLSQENWLSKVERHFGLIFGNQHRSRIFELHSVYREIRCSGFAEDAAYCRRFVYTRAN